ncbi:hypothetical protein [Streptomyces sp. CBMA123]|uniref:hypothetical protein n=1 Tax=Streptomyces sp. CBMA123 TaxID=1896313 RepID=UPI001661CAC4|nr:hypothetical protein [Streptomyces sp. CBMA123]MBD0688546.1 hypothetical protein [Streptomyces sp. CBMA123]
MRATRMAVVLTTALALTTVATASATAAGNGAAAPRTTVPATVTAAVPVIPVTVPAPPATLPAADDPALPTVPGVPAVPALPATPDPSAALGDVVKLVTGLLSAVTSAVPDPAAIQQLVASLQGLLGQLPAVPAPPTVPAPPKLPGSAPAGLQEQLGTLRAQAQALTATTHYLPASG